MRTSQNEGMRISLQPSIWRLPACSQEVCGSRRVSLGARMGDRGSRYVSWLWAAIAALLVLAAAPAATAATQYKYDAQGRLISVIYDNGDRIDYRYDQAGNRTTVVTATSVRNLPPAANTNPVTLSVNEGSGAASVTTPEAKFTDPDNTTLQLDISGVTQGARGVVAFTTGSSTTNGSVSYDVNTGVSGPSTDSFVYSAKDPAGLYATTVVTVTINNVAPTANGDAVTINKNTAVNIAVLANDTDPGLDPLHLGAITSVSHGTATPLADGTVNFTPDAGFSGAASFRYRAVDEDGVTSTSTALVSVTVNNVNNPPVANDDTFWAQVSTARTVDPRTNDDDADGNALTITAKTNGSHGTVTFTSTSVTYTPTTGYTGPDTFTYTISDGAGGTDTGTVLVNVIANTAPDAVNDSKNVAVSTPSTFDPRANDTDAENQSLTITAKTNPSHGAVVINTFGISVTYTPTTGYTGADSFTYTIADIAGATDTATVSLTVAANTAPNAVDDDLEAVGPFGSSAVGSVDVLANDTDAEGNTLTITGTTNGTKGTVSFVGGTITYTTNTGSSIGADTFTYTISDGAGGTDTATVHVSITRE